MKIAICDDLKEHRTKLISYIVEFFKIQQIAIEVFEFQNGEEVYNSEEIFDIAFIDIELGEISGFDVAKSLLKKTPNIIIIIVTSHMMYLDTAMDLHVLRFINKPVCQEKVFSALHKALEEMTKKIITVRLKDNSIIRIRCDSIIYAEANLKFVIIHTTEKEYKVKNSLRELKNKLETDYFAVPHNSYIVNMNFITSFKRDEICLKTVNGLVTIYISNRNQPKFKRRFLEFVGEK